MPSLTRSDLVTRIGDLIGDPNHGTWSESQKQSKIQEWQERFILDTKALKDVQTTAVVSGTSEYALPSDILDVIRVSHNGLKLERVSAYDLDVAYDSNWSDDVGTPQKYFVDLDPNNLKIRLFPIPQGADANYSLIIEYVKIPPSLSSDSSVPLDGNTLLTPYHMAIAYGAASDFMRMSLAHSADPQPVLVQIGEYRKQYDELVTDCIDVFRAMSKSSPRTIAVGRSFGNL